MKSLENYLKEGEMLFTEGKIDEAEECFLSAIEKDENNKDAYNNLGVIAVRKEDVRSAVDYFTKSLEIDPFNKDAIINYADLLKTLDQLHIAAPLLERLVVKDPYDKEITQLLEDIRSAPQIISKIAILCLPDFESFLGDIVCFLKTGYEVRTCYTNNEQEIESAVEWADIVWLEWANQMAMHVTNNVSGIVNKKVICRLHGYEVFTDMPEHINWNVVDRLIFVAKHKQEIFNQRFKTQSLAQFYIRNGVNTDTFKITEKKTNTKRLVLLGHLNFRKGLPMLLQFYHELLKHDPEYHLYIRGSFQEPRLAMAAKTMVHELSLEKKIEFVDWVDDLNTWLTDKSHILSFSLEESFHYSIGNGMAAGLKPVIHAWTESRDIWPEEFIFNDLDSFLKIMQDKTFEPKRYRNLLFENNLTTSTQTANIKNLIDELVNGSPHSSDRVTPQNLSTIQNTNERLQPLSHDKTTQQANSEAKPEKTAFLSESQPAPEKEIIQIRNNYTKNKKLGLLLKHDEAIRDYMDLGYMLQTSEKAVDFNTLIFWLQTNFHTVLTSYLNTLSIPQKETKNIGLILKILDSNSSGRIPLTFDSHESFILQVFHFIKSNLPVSNNVKVISLKSMDKVLQSASMTDFVKDIYLTLGEGFRKLFESKRISLFLIHGSMSTLDYTPFSDVDTQLFITDEVFSSPESLKDTAEMISRQTAYLKIFDPLQHHGFFISTDIDRTAYPQAYLPFATMENGVAVLGNQEQKFMERPSVFENKSAVWNLSYFFRVSFLNQIIPNTPFDMKRYISRFAMLPVLYLELFENIYPYKRDSFQIAPKYIEQDLWSVYETVSMAREKWNPNRLMKLNPAFYKGVFNFSEMLLDRLKEHENG